MKKITITMGLLLLTGGVFGQKQLQKVQAESQMSTSTSQPKKLTKASQVEQAKPLIVSEKRQAVRSRSEAEVKRKDINLSDKEKKGAEL